MVIIINLMWCEMMIAKIQEAKVIKIGESFGITIPKQFITNSLVIPGKKYNIEIQEVKEIE